MELSSVNNDKVKFWASLKLKKYRDLHKKFLIEGDHLVNIALSKGLVEELICINDVYEFSNKYIVTEEIMRKISTQNSLSNVCAIASFFEEGINDGNAIVLDNLQDPGNLGTIIRSAVAFNFNNIILGNNTVDLYNEKVIRATEGMCFNVSFKKLDLENNLGVLKDLGYKIIGTDVNSGDSIKKFKNEKLAIVIGNEGSGISRNIECDNYVNIKMNSKCESLNAGICGSILMYEVSNNE